MKSKKLIALTASALLVAPHAMAATTALDGPWYTGSNQSGTPTFSPNNTSSSFTWGTAGTNTASTGVLWTYFDDITLANDGDFIRVSFTAEWSTTAGSTNQGLRFGLFDTGATTVTSNISVNSDSGFANSLGYFGTIDLGGATTAVVRTAGANNPLSTQGSGFATIGGTNTNVSATAANTAYDFSLQLTRISATQYGFDLIAANGGFTATTSTIIAGNTFNSFYLLNTPSNNLASIQFSNFEISAIPEPTTALLGGLGMLCLLRRRR